jgi:hypothetical protein
MTGIGLNLVNSDTLSAFSKPPTPQEQQPSVKPARQYAMNTPMTRFIVALPFAQGETHEPLTTRCRPWGED